MKITNSKNIEAFLPENNVQREVLSEIIPWLSEREVIVLLGARQTGKTTLMFQIIKKLLLKKAKDEIYYFNLDFPDDKKFLKTPEKIVNLALKNKLKKIIFIDEVQRIKDAGIYLKYLYDLSIPIKIIVSGSGSLELKSKVSEPLTGRKISFSISPFNTKEIKIALPQLYNSIKFKENQSLLFKKAFKYLTTYGGYPSVVLTKDASKRIARLNEIYTSYLEKDIKKFLEIKNEQAFINLVTVLSSSIGNILNKSEISNTLSIHLNTLENYIYYLEQTFVINIIRPFFRNTRKEIVKSPKVYFNDIGIRNFAIKNFNNLNLRADKGFVFENFIYLILKDSIGSAHKINFWRTKAGAEVDFVIQNGLKITPIEVKTKYLKKPIVSQAMRSFINTYKPNEAFIVNFDFDDKISIGKCQVNFLSVEKFVSWSHNLKHS